MKKAAALFLGLASVFSPARRLAKKGVAEFRAKDFAAAGRDFREAAARQPEEKTWDLDAGTAEAAAGDAGAARASFVRAAGSNDPATAAKALYQLGTLDLREQRPEAAGELKRSLELDPSNPDAKRNFEIALRRRKPNPPPPPQGGGPQPKPPSGSRAKGPDDSEFERQAGMTRAEADALLRSLENEQRQRERVSPRIEGKDW